ncbi:hypothetical protein BDZ91DRAFT_722400 [Kalaharituber pfeilii]|nr:hypothetical protein BDZ91DRAFT_722400 [Kalaharituber pfeilii]
MPSMNTKLYPRSVVKRIVKAHTKCKVSKNVDVLLYLDYVLFLQKLMKEAGIELKKAKDKNITARHIKKVQNRVLQQFNV